MPAPYAVRDSSFIGMSNSPYDGLANFALDELMIFNTALSTAQIKQVITSTGLAWYWTFNTNCQDAYTGNSMSSLTNISYVTDRNGRLNSAIFLNGGYASIPMNGIWSVKSSFNSTSVWISVTNWPSVCSAIFSFGGYFDFNFCYSTQRPYLQTSSSNYTMTSYLSINTWTHLGIVMTNGYTQVSFYMNGYFNSNFSVQSFADYNGAVYLSSPSKPLYAYLDDLMFFRTSLSSSQMFDFFIYNS